ncbi:MAG: HEAT repeat domain-containing protein [Desulfobacterales bacterium]|nr:HEAT repeat domain-containing protein [Desulfobacterales bacterium]
MNREKSGLRALKKKILYLLNNNDLEKSIVKILELPARQAINPLFSFLYNADELLKWKAVTAMGAVVSNLADHNMESARIIMRRLLWNLNDESGGIGWGSPEAMGEIMACHEKLAEEYSSILISYIREGGTFIENEELQKGVLWGIGRIAHVKPLLVKNAVPLLLPFMESQHPTSRGLAAWATGALGDKSAMPALKCLSKDNTIIRIFLERHLVDCQVSELALEAMSCIENKQP